MKPFTDTGDTANFAPQYIWLVQWFLGTEGQGYKVQHIFNARVKAKATPGSKFNENYFLQ
jgi:hypothetical protein